MNKEKRIYTAEERSNYVEQWRASGLPMSVFSRNNNISYTTFVHWITGRKTKQERKENNVTVPAPSFVALQIETPPVFSGNTPVMELILAGGHRISFYQTVSTDYIRSLIQ